MEVLEAGRLAPSAHNDQPWEFILVRDKAVLKALEKYCISGRFISQVRLCSCCSDGPRVKVA